MARQNLTVESPARWRFPRVPGSVPTRLLPESAWVAWGRCTGRRIPACRERPPIKVSAERFSERFAGEAEIIASLNHPNISTLYDVGDELPRHGARGRADAGGEDSDCGP